MRKVMVFAALKLTRSPDHPCLAWANMQLLYYPRFFNHASEGRGKKKGNSHRIYATDVATRVAPRAASVRFGQERGCDGLCGSGTKVLRTRF